MSGAIDVVVVKNPSGNLECSPFHVKFPRPSKSKGTKNFRVIKLRVNGILSPLSMKLGRAGEGFFLERTQDSTSLTFQSTSPALNVEVIRNPTFESAPPRSDDRIVLPL